MNTQKSTIKFVIKYGIMLLTAFIFVFYASATTSPFIDFKRIDSYMFLIMGRGWSKGLIPYVDLFDQKGPAIFFRVEFYSQLVQLEAASEKVQIDSCSYRVPNIVLIIGESYNKHHSQLYGYNMPTTPKQKALAQEGTLVPFTDVVAPWNLTSFVFKNILSLQAIGEKEEWCDKPLFPEVFRKAGYHVTFITNQFQSKANEAVYDFSGGFFLNNPDLSKKLFDTRNTRLYPYDEGVLQEYDRLKKEDKEHNLIILHLMGSHLMYKSRYPQNATHKYLKEDMYNRPELTKKQRMILADYDNSVR